MAIRYTQHARYKFEAITKSSAHLRISAASVLYLIPFLFLLALGGRVLAAHFLTNRAGLALLSR